MPVAPGRSVAILVEVAARNQLLRARGHHAARALAERLERSLRERGGWRPDEEEDEDLEPGGAVSARARPAARPRPATGRRPPASGAKKAASRSSS